MQYNKVTPEFIAEIEKIVPGKVHTGGPEMLTGRRAIRNHEGCGKIAIAFFGGRRTLCLRIRIGFLGNGNPVSAQGDYIATEHFRQSKAKVISVVRNLLFNVVVFKTTIPAIYLCLIVLRNQKK